MKAGPADDAYGDPKSLFDEMMNWALISLYAIDNAAPQDVEQIMACPYAVSRQADRAVQEWGTFEDLCHALFERVWKDPLAPKKMVAETRRSTASMSSAL